MAIQIRTIALHELPAAQTVLHEATLPIALDTLALYQQLQPDGFIVAVDQQQIVGTAAAIDYGTCAFVGAVAVHTAFQGRGIGTALMGHLLAWLDARGAAPVLLEATERGEQLYRNLGFVADYRTVVYKREAGAESDLDCQLARELVEPLTAADLDAVVELDTMCFGANRRRLLIEGFARWYDRAFIVRNQTGALAGYAFAWTTRIGPWIATDPAAAEALLDATLTLPFTSEPTVAIPGLNRIGGTLILRAGFAPQRSTQHMRRGGATIVGRPAYIFGRMTLGIG